MVRPKRSNAGKNMKVEFGLGLGWELSKKKGHGITQWKLKSVLQKRLIAHFSCNRNAQTKQKLFWLERLTAVTIKSVLTAYFESLCGAKKKQLKEEQLFTSIFNHSDESEWYPIWQFLHLLSSQSHTHTHTQKYQKEEKLTSPKKIKIESCHHINNLVVIVNNLLVPWHISATEITTLNDFEMLKYQNKHASKYCGVTKWCEKDTGSAHTARV